MAGLTPIGWGVVVATVTMITVLSGIITGLSVEGFLALIVTVNGIELGFIIHNTARISNLTGRYDADHK